MREIGSVYYINRASRLNLFINVFLIILISLTYHLITADVGLLQDEIKKLHSVQDEIISNQEEIKALIESTNKPKIDPVPIVSNKVEVIEEKK